MIFPIKNWPKLRRGFLFGQKYPASFGVLAGHPHLGLDIICPSGTPIYAWQDLTITSYKYGPEGGNTITCKCPNNNRLFRLMHLLHSVKTGNHKQGDVIAFVGNTGSVSTGSHLHIDISKNGILDINNFNNFEDPEAYFKAFVKV
jgi:murein DD-endopeptidase MepM/ murein hydrolase activator NlpD